VSPVHERLYTALGVGADVSPETLERAWRAWLLEHHPDKGGDPRYFLSVKEAYEYVREHGGPRARPQGEDGGEPRSGPAGAADDPHEGREADEEWGERVGWEQPPPSPPPPPPRSGPPPPSGDPPPTDPPPTDPPPAGPWDAGPRRRGEGLSHPATLGGHVRRWAGIIALAQGLAALMITPFVLAGETDHLALARLGAGIASFAYLPTLATLTGFLVWWAQRCRRLNAAGAPRPRAWSTILWLLPPFGPLLGVWAVRRLLVSVDTHATRLDWLLMLSGAITAGVALIPDINQLLPLPFGLYLLWPRLVLLLVAAGVWRLVTAVERAAERLEAR